MDIEYAYLHVVNGKVWAVKPEPKTISAVLPPTDFEIILNQLVEAGWELTNPKFQIAPLGQSLVRIQRERDYQRPQVADNLRIATVEITPSEEDFDRVVEDTKRLYEVNGWDFIQLWRRGGLNFGPTMIFSKPKGAPDVTPFVDPNKE